MIQNLVSSHFTTEDGKPDGGQTHATGLSIAWQRGPLGRGEDRQEPNGCFVETVILAAKDRLEFYEKSPFKCEENDCAIQHLEAALNILNSRTTKRESRGVEGTHSV